MGIGKCCGKERMGTMGMGMVEKFGALAAMVRRRAVHLFCLHAAKE